MPMAVAAFDCVTSPSSPGLSTRIDDAVFDGFTWTAVASASASWLFVAFWPAICVYSEPLLGYLPSAFSPSIDGAEAPPWLWSID